MRFIFIFTFLFANFYTYSQEIGDLRSLEGYVQNSKREAIAGANVFIDGSYDGANTDHSGYFRFSTTQRDSILLRVTALGYSQDSIWLQLPLSKPLVIFLTADQHIIPEVLVKAGEFRIGNQSGAALSPLDIVSTAGSMGNIIAALQTLPGAQVA
ncbi:carboxypeptidase-like regulatory domain-containing protein, partial [Brucella sp. 21LCYQ03]|nr:carboxypeptidase-like regulatory domain-containing protein [Brucella sp. 21LCYQ03]